MDQINSELEVINHLLEVEKQASDMLQNAMEEADKRILSAKTKYNAEYKEEFSKIVEDLQKKYNEETALATENHNKIIEDFKNSLKSKEQNQKAFFSALDKMLF